MEFLSKKTTKNLNFSVKILPYNDKESTPDPKKDYFALEAYIGEKEVANLVVVNNEKEIFAFTVFVHPEYRRKGLATSLYNLAEELSNKKIKPFEYFNSEYQTSNDAVEFWRKRGLNLSGGDRIFDC